MYFTCPNDKSVLFFRQHLWYCPSCQGHFHEKSQLSQPYQDYVKTYFSDTGQSSSKVCPCSHGPMRLLKHGRHGFLLDWCSRCGGIWFNRNLFHRFRSFARRRLKENQGDSSLKDDPELRKKFEHYFYMPVDKAEPTVWQKLFMMITHLPLEMAVKPSGRFPVTRLLVLLNVALYFISAAYGLNDFLQQYAYIPGKTSWFLPSLTSMFLHGDVFHLFGNMYFLWVVGDNVEDFLGSRRYLSLYLCGGLMASAASAIFARESIPHVGASGAIASVLGAYLLLFPRALFQAYIILIYRITVTAKAYLGFWFAFQLLAMVGGGSAHVDWTAHVAGFLAGLAMISLFKRSYQLEPCNLSLPR